MVSVKTFPLQTYDHSSMQCPFCVNFRANDYGSTIKQDETHIAVMVINAVLARIVGFIGVTINL